MAIKKKIKFFPIECCKIIVSFDEDVFTYDGKLDYICHNHEHSLVSYLTWRGGIEEDVYKEAVKKAKKEKKNETSVGKDS